MPSPLENFGRVLQRVAAAHSCCELAVFSVGPDASELPLLYHLRGGEAVDQFIKDQAIWSFRQLVQWCIDSNRDGAMQIASESRLRFPQFCLVSLARRRGSVVGAIACIVRCQDAKVASALLETIQQEIQKYREWPPRGFVQ